MEYCAGGSVSDLYDATQRTLDQEDIRVILAYTVLGLHHLHTHNSIHRVRARVATKWPNDFAECVASIGFASPFAPPQDVKAGNILLSKDGKAKLGEFCSFLRCGFAWL